MQPPRPPGWLLLLGCLAVAAIVLGWLLLGFTANRSGMQSLPDATGSTVEYLRETGRTLLLPEVVSQPDDAWQRPDGPGFVPPNERRTAWVRVTLKNPQSKALAAVLADRTFYSDRVDLFTPDDTEPGGWLHLHSGEWTPAKSKALWGRETAFSISVPARGERKVYLRYEDYFAVWLELVWWPDQELFQQARLRDALGESCYFGTLLALLFYNAVLWARLRFRDTGRYLLYLGTFTSFMVLSRGGILVIGWQMGSPWLESITMMLLALSGAFLAEFARVFLELPARAQRADRGARATRAIMVVLAISALASPWIPVPDLLFYIILGSGLTHLSLVAIAIAAWRAGARQARYFILALGLLFAAIVPTVAIWLEIPLEDISKTVMLSVALEMLLLSVATADRFAQIQRDKLIAQSSLLEEAAHRQTLQEAYSDELALEVRERTAELEAANTDKDRMLAVLAHDLRSPLTGLTLMAEDLTRTPAAANLERFTSDTAQTGRALLLMIEDLVLWAHLRAGAVRMSPHPARALIVPAAAMHRSLATQGGVELLVEVPDDLWVEADLVPAQTLIRNLLGNALKVARRQVLVSAVTTPEGVWLAVRDDGPGLPPEVAAWVAADVPIPLLSEIGLGLRLCGEISGAMGTRLRTTPMLDGGTELGFLLPLANGDAAL